MSSASAPAASFFPKMFARSVSKSCKSWTRLPMESLSSLTVSVRQTHVDGGRETSLEIVRPVSASRSKLWG
jgi:hypothetical protein